MARYDQIPERDPDLSGKGKCVAIVVGRFNANVGDGLLSACTAELTHLGVAPEDILIVSVPGALEIPLALRHLARSGRYHALIALGAVIRGETYHFEVVSNESARGVAQVQLECGIPCANGILTTEDDDQAYARLRQKGTDVAQVAVEMANLVADL